MCKTKFEMKLQNNVTSPTSKDLFYKIVYYNSLTWKENLIRKKEKEKKKTGIF